MSISDDDNLFEGNNDEFNSKGPEEDTDFYAVLNVPRDATIEDINRAYKQRSLIFHPDRHTDEQDKQEAAKIFCLLKKAHETLTDPQLRAIYDTIGIQGINLEGWQLVSRSTNPENIRREYEFLSRLRETEIMMERIHPTNSFVFRASIAGLFQADEDEWFSILGMNLAQGVDCGFTGVDRVGLAGRVRFNERGLGDGSVQFSYKRPISASTHLENFFTLSPNQLSFSSKVSLPLLPSMATNKWLSWFKGSTLMLQPTVQYNTTNESFNLSLVPVAFFPLGPNFQGALQFNLGLKQYAAMTVSFAYLELNHPKFLLNLTISPLSPTLRLAYHLRYPQNEQHYETSCVLSLTEITPSITLERRLTKYSKVGLQLLFSYPSFLLQANFRIKAGLSNYEFRFVFCEQQDDFARAALYGIILPGLVLNATRLMFRPYFSQLMRIFEGRNIDEAVVEARKEQAQKAVHLMRETAEKVAREEERKKGLIIVEAQYGEMVNDTPGYELYPVAGERLIDVTIPLQALVNDSQLRIYSGKTQIPGFYDPCVGEPKMLKVIYRFHDKLHAVCIPEDQPLMIPMREHCIVDGRQ